MNKVAVVAKMNITHGLINMDCPLPKADLATAAECQMCPQLRPTLHSRCSITSWNKQAVSRWKVDCSGLIPGWKGHNFVLTWIDTYSDFGFAFPACNVFAKIICKLTEVLIYHHDIPHSIACFWPWNSLHSQRRVSVGPWSWNPLILSCSQPSWVNWNVRKMEWHFKDTVTAKQVAGSLESWAGFSRSSICFESVSKYGVLYSKKPGSMDPGIKGCKMECLSLLL